MPRERTLRARWLRSHQTDAERVLWKLLRLRQFSAYKFRRQYPVGPYIVDFVCLERKLVIEVDGAQHAAQPEYDARRERWLLQGGLTVVRFTNREVLTERSSVCERILQVLESPPPQPSPTRGEGA